MPAPRVHAVLVARPDSRALGLTHFTETIEALRAQTVPVEALTIVLCGRDTRFAAAADASGAEGIIQTDGATGFAAAVALASARVEPDRALWLLAQDTLPAPDALALLSAQLELGPSIAVVAPKLVQRADPDVIASLGVSMTAGGAAVELAAGQFDQGQHDAREDVLGADVRGMLLRAERRADLLPDPALGGGDEGLDIGVRARLGGARVAIAPQARVSISSDGVAGLPEPKRSADRRRIDYVTRLAQLHRRLTYTAPVLVPLHIMSFLPIMLWRALVSLLAKLPGRVLPEAGATIVAASRWGAITRSRARLKGLRGNWRRVEPLRISRRDRRGLRADDGPDGSRVRTDLRFFAGGGAWTVLASLVLSVIVFPLLVGWPALGGGGALPLRGTLAGLWADTAYGVRGYGLGEVAPADPFSVVVALLGSLVPAVPSTAVVLLWMLALPLATLGGWFAATRITERSGLRIAAAIAWTLAPTFLTSLLDPRPAAVLVHLFLPWVFFAASVAHRSWAAAGAASLLLGAVAACSPALGALIVAAVVIGTLFALAWRRYSAALRLLWLIVPTAVFFFPLVWRRLAAGDALALLADPGAVYQGARAGDDIFGRLATLVGFARGDLGGWPAFLTDLGLGPDVAAWAPLVLLVAAPWVVLALVGPFTRRWPLAITLLVGAAAAGVATIVATHVSVAAAEGSPVTLWPGPLQSAFWLCIVLAAILAADALPGPRLVPSLTTAVAAALVMLSAVPAATAVARGTDHVQNGPRSTLPAYVAATLEDGGGGGTLVLTVLADGSVAQRVVWGASDTLGAQSTVSATRIEATDAERALANEIADLVTPATDGATHLAASGIRFVLVEPVRQTTGPASALRAQAVASLDQRAGLAAVGETGRGALWQVEEAPAARAALSDSAVAISRAIGLAWAVIALIAVLLAIPTRQSMRNARAKSRVVGERSVTS